MTTSISLDGVEVAKDIRLRCRKIGRSVKSVCVEAKTSYRAYRSWRAGERNPSMAKLKPIYAILDGRANG